MEAVLSPSSRTFHSAASAQSTHTKIRLPIEEAIKANFPPGTKVLCFDDNGVRVGLVRNVMVSISLPSQRTFGTFYEVEMKGSSLQDINMNGIFTASDLRLTPDCPVEVNASYFGDIFKIRGESATRSVPGTILGSFETPPSRCTSCAMRRPGETPVGVRKYFYSVRVKFDGMEEAVEAHGVPPEYVAVRNNFSSSDASTISEGMESLIISGGPLQAKSFGFESDIYKENGPSLAASTPRRTPRRLTPEDVPMADFSNTPDDYVPENRTEALNAMYQHESSTKAFGKVISNGDREIYDSSSSSFEQDRRTAPAPAPAPAHQRRSRARSRSVSRSAEKLQPRGRSRSTNQMRTYSKPQPARNARPNAIPTAPPTPDHGLKIATSAESDEMTHDSVQEYEARTPFVETNQIEKKNSSPQIPNDYETDESFEEVQKVEKRSPKKSKRLVMRQAFDIDDGDDDDDDDRESLQPTPRSRSNLTDVRNSPEKSYSEDEVSAENFNDDEVEENFRSEIDADVESYVEPKKKIALPQESKVLQTPKSERKSRRFGSSWSPSVSTSGSPIENLSQEKKPQEKSSTKSLFPSPVEKRSDSSANLVSNDKKVSRDVQAAPVPVPINIDEGCYLLFDDSSGGKLTLQYSKEKVDASIGFWGPGQGKKIQGFKFKQNQGRSDLVSGIAGKDYKKKYFNGWCQFVKAAKNQNGFLSKWSENERIGVDVYVYFGETCEIEMVEDGKSFDVSQIDAVSVLPKGNNTFNGVHICEYGTFLGRGDAAGASMAL